MKKRVFWVNIMLVFALIIGQVMPVTQVNAATKNKKDSPKILIVYFSGTGTTKSAAEKIKKAAGGKLYAIKAKNPYTDEDLDYDNEECRANIEQQDETVRPEIKGKIKNMRSYDVIFLGYPIWWGKEPMIIRTFLETYNLKGKTVVPFCTSGGSGISGSMKDIKKSAKGAKVVKGKDLTDLSYKSVKKWATKQMK